jgi:hypothetical protein
MLLYHFTSHQNLPSILAHGLGRGIVHTGPASRINGVWLTADCGPDGHGLESGGRFMSEAERQEAYEWSGVRPPPGARFAKKAEVRICVEVYGGDRNLVDWLPWARRHLPAEWLAQLHPIASQSLRRAKSWRLYFGTIPPEAFVSVERFEEPAPLAQPSLAWAG